jgi:hypothetical protein
MWWLPFIIFSVWGLFILYRYLDKLKLLRFIQSITSIFQPKVRGSAELKRGNKLLITYSYDGEERKVYVKFTSGKKQWKQIIEKDIDGVETDVTSELVKYCDPNDGFFTGITPEILGHDQLKFIYQDGTRIVFEPNQELIL